MRRHGSAATGGLIHRSATGFSRRAILIWLAPVLTVALLMLAQSASAAPIFKFKEVFGGATPPTFLNPTDMAVDQSTGDLLVMDKGAGTIRKFNPDGTTDDFSALGTNVIDETPEGPLAFPPNPGEQQIAVDNSGTPTDGTIYVTSGSANVIYIFGRSGGYLGKLTEGGGQTFSEACGVAVDSSGAVYVGDFNRGIFKFAPTGAPPVESSDFVRFLELPQSPCTLDAGVGPTASYLFPAGYEQSVYKQNKDSGDVVDKVFDGPTTTVAVDPNSGQVLAAHREEVTEFNASSASQATPLASFSVGSEIQGIAVGPSGDTYVSRAGAEELEVWTHLPLPTPAVDAATGVSFSDATLNGTVDPEGEPVTACSFEYGPTTTAGFESEAPCSPPAAAIPSDSSPHEVTAAISGLQPNTTYKYRISAANAIGTEISEVLTFTTSGSPRIAEIRARDADQTSVMLEAKINPSGANTSYHFEWGPTASYGHSVPADFEPFIGSGTEPVRVTAKVSGLSAGMTYRYRVVAVNGVDVTESPDQTFETLNSCNLPEGRCFELVSPRDPGPISLSGETTSSEHGYQSADAQGSLAYPAEIGLPDATKGAGLLYGATRGANGWSSIQLSAPMTARNETAKSSSGSAKVWGLSNDLSCSITESMLPLTTDASADLAFEAGGGNLYRRNPDGSYTLITKLPPENPLPPGEPGENQGFLGTEYEPVGFTPDCGKVVFRTAYRYPGVEARGAEQVGVPDYFLYEWDEGTLRGVGFVPGPSGEMAVAATAGTSENHTNVISENGSRIFFTAERQTSDNPGEIGKDGVFVRENGAVTRDLSLSETSTPDAGAKYQWATPDGSRVFFTANAGLTADSNAAGTDLYEYDLETESLSDLSVGQGEDNEAQVAGFIGGSRDGSTVYFVARGQLLPGRGRTLAQNQDANTLSIYASVDGQLKYVGPVTDIDIRDSSSALVVDYREKQTASVSPDGGYLLYQSRIGPGDQPSSALVPAQAYLYDAEAGSQNPVCISCRADGQASVSPTITPDPLKNNRFMNSLHSPRNLLIRNGEPRVFFMSFDRLAVGAVEGLGNLYMWAHGQVFTITTEPPGLKGPDREIVENGKVRTTQSEIYVSFGDASLDGTDVYFYTPKTLTWEDEDEKISVYDARIGGGFAEPPPAPPSCDPTTEGSCQGPSKTPAPASNAGSTTFTGPGNQKSKKSKKKRHKKSKHRGTKKHGKKHQKKHGKKHQGNGNRRVGK